MGKVKISVVIPVLNEENGLKKCLRELRSISKVENKKYKFEIVVADNGSTDQSVQVARKFGAKVIRVEKKGYGSALKAGLAAAKGEILVFTDGDGSYDFSEINLLLDEFFLDTQLRNRSRSFFSGQEALPLRFGALVHWLNNKNNRSRNVQKKRTATDSLIQQVFLNDLVVGSRLKGNIEKDAMPFTHRYLGTPFLNFLFKIFFKQNFSDVNSGFRALTKKAFVKMQLTSNGMEFASEMLYKAGKLNLRIAEVPISYHKRIGRSKLSVFRDAWRHLKFLLLFAPQWLFILPGGFLGGLGGLGVLVLAFGPVDFLGKTIDIHTMIVCSFMAVSGFQLLFLGFFAKVFAANFLGINDFRIQKMMQKLTLEKGVGFGLLFFSLGFMGFLHVLFLWAKNQFGELSQVRYLLFSLTFLVLGIEIIFSSFFFGIIGKEER